MRYIFGFICFVTLFPFLSGNFVQVWGSTRNATSLTIEEVEDMLVADPLQNVEDVEGDLEDHYAPPLPLPAAPMLRTLSYLNPFDLLHLEYVCKYFEATVKSDFGYDLWKRFLDPVVAKSIEAAPGRTRKAKAFYFMELAKARGSRTNAEKRLNAILEEKLKDQSSALSMLFGVGRIPDGTIIPQKWKKVDTIYELGETARQDLQKEWLKRVRDENQEKMDQGEDLYDSFNPPHRDATQITVFWVQLLGYVPENVGRNLLAHHEE